MKNFESTTFVKGKKFKLGNNFIDLQKFSEIGGNLKHGENTSLGLEGWTPLIMFNKMSVFTWEYTGAARGPRTIGRH